MRMMCQGVRGQCLCIIERGKFSYTPSDCERRGIAVKQDLEVGPVRPILEQDALAQGSKLKICMTNKDVLKKRWQVEYASMISSEKTSADHTT